MKLKYVAIFLVLLCCLMGAASAAEDVSTDVVSDSVDDVAVDEVVSEVDSADDSIAAENDEDLESVDDSVSESLAVQDDEQTILGISDVDVLSDNPIDLYVNASSDKTAASRPGRLNSDANALSWETAPSIGFDGPEDLFENIIQYYDMEGYDIFNINAADGIYYGISGFPNDVNYIGYGNNVVFKLNDLSY